MSAAAPSAPVLLTGAAGFIGAQVAAALLDAGHPVLGVDDLNDAYDVRLKRWRLARLEARPGFRFAQVDVREAAALAQACGDGPLHAVVNLAARAGVRASVREPRLFVETNVLGTLNLLELCRARAVPKFVLASTSSLYGAHNPRPFREDADLSRPLSVYAASKGAAELLCHSYHNLHGLDVTVLRYFNVYGPAGRPDSAAFRFVQWLAEGRAVRIYGDGTQQRDFTFVGDIARGTLAALRPLGYEIINLGSDRPVVLLDLLGRLEGLLESRAAVEHHAAAPADVQATWADIRKAGALLGWEPQVSLDEGLQACIDWYRAERDWAQAIDTSD